MTSVMVVDDEPGVRFLLERILEKAGYEVEQAEDGEDAIEKLKAGKPDVMLLDVMMPELDGWETLKRIRQNEETRDLPVIMVTVKSEDVDKEKSFQELADAHISKPIIREKLLATVDWVLKNIERRGY